MREQAEITVHASPVAGRRVSAFGYGIVIAVVAAVFMSVISALSTDVIPLTLRLIYWGVVMISGHLIGTGVTLGIRSWGRLNSKPWIECAVIALVIALPLTSLVAGANALFFGIAQNSITALFFIFCVVAFVSAVMTAINTMIGKSNLSDTEFVSSPAKDAALEPAAIPAERLRLRMALHLQTADIWAIESEDHYLRIHTELGSDLILMRLSDAIAETKGLDGAQTHRSWWVARSAVIRTERSDGRATLYLKGSVIAPVSRTYTRALTASGWLKSQV